MLKAEHDPIEEVLIFLFMSSLFCYVLVVQNNCQ